MSTIRMIATDMDGTFLRPDDSYDRVRFVRLFDRMRELDVRFVVASGNQYWQLRGFFPELDDEVSYVAENGAWVVDRGETVFQASVPADAVRACVEAARAMDSTNVCVNGAAFAYVGEDDDEDFYQMMRRYYPRIKRVPDVLDYGDDTILKLSLVVPGGTEIEHAEELVSAIGGVLVPTVSGHEAVDVIMPGCHKASGLARLAERWGIAPEECVAFGDSGNDAEMLSWAGRGFAMANASQIARESADAVCGANTADGVLEKIEELLG